MTDFLKIFLIEEKQENIDLIKRLLPALDATCVLIIATDRQDFVQKTRWLRPDVTVIGVTTSIFEPPRLRRILEAFPDMPLIVIRNGQPPAELFARAAREAADTPVLTGAIEDLLDLLQAIVLIDHPRSRHRKAWLEALNQRDLLDQKRRAANGGDEV